MEVNLENKKVIIIGATDVLGYTCAEVLASEGCSLALVDPDMAALKAVTTQLREGHDGITITSHAGDVSDPVWQKSVREVIDPVDLIVFNWTRFAFDSENISARSKTAIDISPVSLKDLRRVSSIFEFCSQLVAAMGERKASGVLVTLLGSMSYAVANRKKDLSVLESEFWPTLFSAGRSFTESIGKSSKNPARSVAIEVDGVVSETGDATEFEIQVADVVAFMLSERSAAISGSTIMVEQ